MGQDGGSQSLMTATHYDESFAEIFEVCSDAEPEVIPGEMTTTVTTHIVNQYGT